MRAMVLEGGTSMFYYTGVRWGISERTFLLVIPAKGELAWVTPAFEEERARELIKFSNDVRVWQEDESPYQADRAASCATAASRPGKVGIEERLRFFIFDGLRQGVARRRSSSSATPVTAGCRMIKSPAEIALMQRANDITLEAFRAAFTTLQEGMTQGDLARQDRAALPAARRRRRRARALRQVHRVSARQHPAAAAEGGRRRARSTAAARRGLQSDITRTTVFGKPTQRQRDVWESRRGRRPRRSPRRRSARRASRSTPPRGR